MADSQSSNKDQDYSVAPTKETTMANSQSLNKHQDYVVVSQPTTHSVNDASVQYDHPQPFPADQHAQARPSKCNNPPNQEKCNSCGQYLLSGHERHLLNGQYLPPQPILYPSPGQAYAIVCGKPCCSNVPVVNQTMQLVNGGWKDMPQNIPACPPGLECLTSPSNLSVRQTVRFRRSLGGKSNKFTIKNDKGKIMFYTFEETDACASFFAALRPLELIVRDKNNTEIIRLHRPLKCASCCFPCCLQRMEVFAPPGNLLGTVEQNWSIFYPNFSIKDAAGVTVLKIKGPIWGLAFCGFTYCGKMEFQILSRDGRVKVGKISREWLGFMEEVFTCSNKFRIWFPEDLDVRIKTVLIGAVILIDAIYYDRSE